DQRHHEIHDAVALVDAVDLDDVGMRELRRGLRLAREPRAHVRVEREFRRQHLERHGPIQPQVDRAIDDGHAAATDLALDQVVGTDRGGDAIQEVIRHPWAADRPLGRAPASRFISSATNNALSTLSASESASMASDVMCWWVCAPAPRRSKSNLMFCNATEHVSSLAAMAERRPLTSATPRRWRRRCASRRTRSSLAAPSSGLAAPSSRAISESMLSAALGGAERSRSASEIASILIFSASASAERPTSGM